MSSSSDGGDVVRPAVIEVLWRPGCPFCTRLRRELTRSGVITTERDIWSDPDAAARVRAATAGDETVPTVVVGDRALVNPRLAQVVAAVREEFPDEADTLLGSAADRPVTPVWQEGALAGLVVAVLWVVLAAWEPTTTWHLAPFLAGAAPPWLLSRGAGPSRGGPPLLRRVRGHRNCRSRRVGFTPNRHPSSTRLGTSSPNHRSSRRAPGSCRGGCGCGRGSRAAW